MNTTSKFIKGTVYIFFNSTFSILKKGHYYYILHSNNKTFPRLILQTFQKEIYD